MMTTDKKIRVFRACDEDGNLYKVVEYQRIIRSGENRSDGMSSRPQVRSYYVLEGTDHAVLKIEDEAHAYKIVQSDQLIWEITK